MRISNKHMERCPTLVMRQMQIKTVMTSYYTAIKMATASKDWPY
jgi:hypothetical protein